CFRTDSKKRYDELMVQEERERQQIRKLVDEIEIDEPDNETMKIIGGKGRRGPQAGRRTGQGHNQDAPPASVARRAPRRALVGAGRRLRRGWDQGGRAQGDARSDGVSTRGVRRAQAATPGTASHSAQQRPWGRRGTLSKNSTLPPPGR